MTNPVLVGAVLYDPKVSIIWDIIRDFFESQGCPIDVVFYTNYELQVKALADGHIDMAWNSPLAWLDSVRQTGGTCRAIAMRDTDRDRVTHFVVPQDSAAQSLEDLRGKTLAVGAKDSPQATLIPLGVMQQAGLEPGEDFEVRRFDLLVGKHGDHVGGELEAFKCMAAGEADASCMLDLNWDGWTGEGIISPSSYRILATTPRFDHCVFTVRADFDPALEKRWLEALYAMTYENPDHREMMDMEGLKAWEEGRTSGFGPLGYALEKQAYFEGSDA